MLRAATVVHIAFAVAVSAAATDARDRARTVVRAGKYVSVLVGDKTCDVRAYGAVGDGKTDDAAAIQMAIDDCAHAGGGEVLLSPGAAHGGELSTDTRFFIAAGIVVKGSHLAIHVPAGVTLVASDDIPHWPKNQHIISVTDATDIALVGGGTVDGQGEKWWRAVEQPGQQDMFRPHTVDANGVTGLLLQDITFQNGPNHVLELYADHAELDSVRVLNPPSPQSHNTDAVDVHGTPFYIHDVCVPSLRECLCAVVCWVRVCMCRCSTRQHQHQQQRRRRRHHHHLQHNNHDHDHGHGFCLSFFPRYFDTGDDNVAAHANHTLVEDSVFGFGHGASIGSLCNDFLTNITFRNITFNGTTAGARIKSHPKCGGHLWDVTYERLRMTGVQTPVDITQCVRV
jgi:polygalacturonase